MMTQQTPGKDIYTEVDLYFSHQFFSSLKNFREGNIYNYYWFELMYSGDHDIVKQLSSN